VALLADIAKVVCDATAARTAAVGLRGQTRRGPADRRGDALGGHELAAQVLEDGLIDHRGADAERTRAGDPARALPSADVVKPEPLAPAAALPRDVEASAAVLAPEEPGEEVLRLGRVQGTAPGLPVGARHVDGAPLRETLVGRLPELLVDDPERWRRDGDPAAGVGDVELPRPWPLSPIISAPESS
jgi:hypothetical protein